MEGQMSTEQNIRVSDADRDAVAAQLREHYAQGRLTMDELNDRLDRVFAARTNLELASVTSDLPYASPRGVLPSDRVGGSGPWRGNAQFRRDQRGGQDERRHPGWDRSILGIIPLVLAVWCLIILLGVMGFGLGSGPSIVVIVLGALALLRRLLGLGRRRRSMPVRRRCRRW
jgi:Flp pilus assembly protein TadB